MNKISFGDFELCQAFVDALATQDVTEAFPVQNQSFEAIYGEQDVAVKAPTGTGKTLAYLLPTLSRVVENNDENLLILAPSPELAMQIVRVIDNLLESFGIKAIALIASANLERQRENLRKSDCRVVVATPGRAADLIESKHLKSTQFTSLVLDESDTIMQDAQKDLIEYLINSLRADCQLVMASATIGEASLEFADEYMRDNYVTVDGIARLSDIEFSYLFCGQDKKEIMLSKLIVEKKLQKVLVFVNSLNYTNHVKQFLEKQSVPAASINADDNKIQRQQAIDDFANGKARALIATDTVARGLDIEGVTVVQYNTTTDPELFTHRAGRAARAGSEGQCFLMVTAKDVFILKILKKKLAVKADEVLFRRSANKDVLVKKKKERGESTSPAKKKKPKKKNRKDHAYRCMKRMKEAKAKLETDKKDSDSVDE